MSTYPDNVRMGTKAIHNLGDVSRDEADYFIVAQETEGDYFGNWLTGFGFINVRFPKDSTRPMTTEERKFLLYNPVVNV